MRGLHGDLGTMPLKDIVAYLGNRRATGTLRVKRGDQQKQVVLSEGRVVNASSNEPREYLGQFLINGGQITEEQLARAYQTQRETHIYLGKILVMIGAVTEAAVHDALHMKFRETVLGAFGWEDGTFQFDPDAVSLLPDGMELKVDLLDLHREGEFRETAWQAIRGAFPTGSVRLRLDESKLGQWPPSGSLDDRLFTLIAQQASIDEILLALHATDFFLYQRLYALHRQGAVKVVEATNPGQHPPAFGDVPVGEEASQAEVIAAARAQVDAGNFAAAEPLARRALEMGPSPEAEAVLRRAETGCTEQLRRELFDGHPIPSLLVPPSQLKSLRLSPPERYLLSRVDGHRDVASIVHVSPLQEPEALRLFHRFLEVGLIAVARR